MAIGRLTHCCMASEPEMICLHVLRSISWNPLLAQVHPSWFSSRRPELSRACWLLLQQES